MDEADYRTRDIGLKEKIADNLHEIGAALNKLGTILDELKNVQARAGRE